MQTTPTLTSAPPAQRPGQSPLRFLYALFARLQAVDGPRMETDLGLEALEEHSAEISQCSAASVKVESGLDRFAAQYHAALADGVIDARENQQLTRAMHGLKRQAHAAIEKIGALQG